MDKSSSGREPEQLMLLDRVTALPLEGLQVPARNPRKRANEGLKLQFHLGPLGTRLREHAARRGVSMAALVRRATLKLLDEEQGPTADGQVLQPFEHSARNVHFHLNLPEACSRELTDRARAADMTRGEFVWSLLKGLSPPAVPADHKAAVLALRESTDRLALLSTDLSELLRLLTSAAATKEALNPYRDSIRSLGESVREHMRVASVLIAELKPFRRARW